MPTVTSIKPQGNKKRVDIFIDGKFGFSLDLEMFVKSKLKVEKTLTNKEIEKIIEESKFRKIYDKLLRFASIRPRSEKEFRDWLKKHRVEKSFQLDLFNKLKRLGLLDDKKFAIWWVDQRQSFRPKPKRVLSLELRIKGVNKKIIDEVLKEVEIDEIAMAKKLLEKKKDVWRRLDKNSYYKKVSGYLLRKGFSWDVISQIIKEIDGFDNGM